MLASSTLPFDDRQNAGVVANALQLKSALRSMDQAGSQRAGSTALAAALDGAAAAGLTLVVASDARKSKAGSTQEMHYGDGAAAMLVGHGEPIARLIASHSETVDFVHQYRMHDRAHDYAWEERWVRDEGYMKIVPRAVSALLAKSGVEAGAITHFCMPGTLSRIGAAVAKRCGLNEGAVRDNLAAVCGDTGVAHPLLMLAAALEDAKPGDRILLAAFGEGCDALLFEVTAGHRQAERAPRRQGRAGSAARRRQLHALPVVQRPARHGARHARRARQADADDGAVPQPRHDPGPDGRQVPRLRHGAVPAPALLRQPGMQRAGQPGRLCVLGALAAR